jgi:hypothetical protein
MKMMEAIYQVVGNGHSKKMYWEEFEEMFSAQFDGIENGSHLRDCLKGQPKIKGMCGPMYNGEHMGYPCVRYESWAVYDAMSK